MSASITVTYATSPSDTPYYAYALTATVDAAQELPREIFVFQRGAAPAPVAGAEAADAFVCIADPVDLEELPVRAPDIDQEIPYFRTHTVTLLFRSPDERQETMADIQDDIAALIDTINACAAVSETVTVTYPEAQ